MYADRTKPCGVNPWVAADVLVAKIRGFLDDRLHAQQAPGLAQLASLTLCDPVLGDVAAEVGVDLVAHLELQAGRLGRASTLLFFPLACITDGL